MSATTLITTERTYLQTPDSLTFEQIRKLDSDPEVMRYITTGQPKSAVDSERWLQIKLDDYQRNGFGLMPAFLIQNDAFIGWGGLKYLDNTSQIELGYRLDKPFWGQGFATEISLAIIKYARETLSIKQLVAVTDLKNEASKKVLIKCGFKVTGEAFYYNTHVSYFELAL